MELIRCRSFSHIHSLLDDLIIEILLRLPVKSLVRFTSVCRQWHTIIRSQRFIYNHFHLETNNSTGLVWVGVSRYRRRERGLPDVVGCSLFRDGITTLLEPRYENLDRGSMPGPVLVLRGPCNGIFCALRKVDREFVLWNPTTRKLRSIPSCPIDIGFFNNFGFGRDPITNDIKIVVINESVRTRVALYNSRNDSWRLYEDETLFVQPFYVMPNKEYSCTFSNGFCYWIRYHSDTFQSFILAFDMHTDLFHTIEMPDIIKDGDETTLDFYNGALCLITYHNMRDPRRVNIWLMKEQGRWTKLASLLLPFDIYTPIGIFETNKIYASTSTLELIIYDMESHYTRNIEYKRREDGYACHYFLRRYKESLASV